MLLEIRRLSKSFGSLKAADGIDLAVARGEAVGIIGPNGAGKSTLVQSDRRQSRAGCGGDPARWRRRHRHERARALQAPGSAAPIRSRIRSRTLTVFENLLVAAVHGRGAEARRWCRFLRGYSGAHRSMRRANAPAGTLTLLERKRLEMARALATGPELLLLDEIAGGLTESECHELVATIKSIRADGTTIVWIEHIVHALLAVVDRLVVLNFGRKIAEGHPQTVMSSAEVRQIYTGIAA